MPVRCLIACTPGCPIRRSAPHPRRQSSSPLRLRKDDPMKGLETLERFRIDVTDHVATLTIAAPPVNSQDRKFREEIIRIFDVLGAETDVRAIVLTGDGKIFSAGAALSARPAPLQEAGRYSEHDRLVRAAVAFRTARAQPPSTALDAAAHRGR